MKDDFVICRGYLRKDGRKGIRNKLLVLYTVDCASFIAGRIADELKSKGFDADLVGTRICFDNQDMIDRLLAFSVHPNVGAVLVVGFGCEYIQASKISAYSSASGRCSEWFYVQEHGGTTGSIAYGVEAGERLYSRMKAEETGVDFKVSDLCVAMECGGSDFTSGLTANYLVGKISDRIVSNGGTTVFEEPGEMIGLHDYLRGRAASEKAAEQIDEFFEKISRYSEESGMFHISPGNFNGGLSSIEEKSIGSVCKSGTARIEGVLNVTQKPPHPGLWIMDRLQNKNMAVGATVASDAGGLMNMITLGCQLCILTTGRGHVVGTPISPTIKITGNFATYSAMKDDIDFDAHELLTDKNRSEKLENDFMDLIIRICRGEKTRAEILGHCEYEMLPSFQNIGCRKA